QPRSAQTPPARGREVPVFRAVCLCGDRAAACINAKMQTGKRKENMTAAAISNTPEAWRCFRYDGLNRRHIDAAVIDNIITVVT
ncbi:MAG: hypothetical protein PVF06_08350, partial [Gammaproteobacteria bacterium]